MPKGILGAERLQGQNSYIDARAVVLWMRTRRNLDMARAETVRATKEASLYAAAEAHARDRELKAETFEQNAWERVKTTRLFEAAVAI
jgi:hypothetical protein